MRLFPRTSATALTCLLLSITGCSVGPDFKQPDAPKVASYTRSSTSSTPDAIHNTQMVTSGDLKQDVEWWKHFHSPHLNALVEQALKANPTIAAAQATLIQAQQTYAAQSGATRYPTANLSLGAERQTLNEALFGQSGTTNAFNLYSSNVSVSYMFDVFGANRRNLEALASQSNYQFYQLQAAQLTLAGSIVTTAMTQAALSAQITATQNILAAQQKSYDLAQQRYSLGAIPLADVLSLKTQLEQLRATIPPLNFRLQQTNHLLASLVGQFPANYQAVPFTLSEFTFPKRLPWVVPSELVRIRPDIQAAEALLHAATAQYGAAIANTYPQINLTAGIGQESLTSATLFSPSSTFWSLAGGLTQPLFNMGLKAGVKAAQANLAIVDANYQQTVLQAFRNVADALRAVDNDTLSESAQAAADQAAQSSANLANQQFSLGSINELQLLTAQQQAEQTSISLILARTQKFTDAAALYQAMGGAATATSASTTQAATPLTKDKQ